MSYTKPVSGDLSMENLAASLTTYEQLVFEKVSVLKADATSSKNILTLEDCPDQLGALFICKAGGASGGNKLFTTTAFISGHKLDVDVYRLPLVEA